MAYEPKTKNLDLGDGQAAVLYLEIKHGTQRKVNELTRPFLKFKGGSPSIITDGDKVERKGATEAELDMAGIPWDEVTDVIILGQVKEWSFGPVNQETLDEIPEDKLEALKNEINIMYGKSGPFQKGGGGN